MACDYCVALMDLPRLCLTDAGFYFRVGDLGW